MAVAIIRQLTLAQVQAAIDAGSTSWNNNYAGTQVYVTDKDWHLACYLDRIAKPLSGVLKITNGDTLPNWLTPERLIVETTTLTGDYSVTPYEITIPNGYTFIGAWIETLGYYEAINILSPAGRVIDEMNAIKGYVQVLNTDGGILDTIGLSRTINLTCSGSAGIIVQLDLIKTP